MIKYHSHSYVAGHASGRKNKGGKEGCDVIKITSFLSFPPEALQTFIYFIHL